MLADFALRLAAGMTLCLLLLSPRRTARPLPGRPAQANANFFRTQMLVAMALALGTFLWVRTTADTLLLACLILAAVFACLGSVSWSLEGSPCAVTLIVLTALSLLVALVQVELHEVPNRASVGLFLGMFTGLALLGSATSAMLMGHNYLVAPTMSLTPLFRLLTALAVSLVLRAIVDGVALGQWTATRSLAHLTAEQSLWLMIRWAVGILAASVLCWMAWQTTRIRSTQSATGILYVVVIFCFLGELTGQLLRPAGLTF